MPNLFHCGGSVHSISSSWQRRSPLAELNRKPAEERLRILMDGARKEPVLSFQVSALVSNSKMSSEHSTSIILLSRSAVEDLQRSQSDYSQLVRNTQSFSRNKRRCVKTIRQTEARELLFRARQARRRIALCRSPESLPTACRSRPVPNALSCRRNV